MISPPLKPLLSALFTVVAFTTFANESAKAPASKNANKNKFSCNVDGHGPYDGDQQACVELAYGQARTNCVLGEKGGVARYEYKEKQRKRTIQGHVKCQWNKTKTECSVCKISKTP